MVMVSNGPSPAAKRIIAAGLAYQRKKQPPRTPLPAAPLWPAVTMPPDRFSLVVEEAMALFGVTRADILNGKRPKRTVALARFYTAQRLMEIKPSLSWVARKFGKDHTTILHACRPKQRERVKQFLSVKDKSQPGDNPVRNAECV